jgi:hypothetical protein
MIKEKKKIRASGFGFRVGGGNRSDRREGLPAQRLCPQLQRLPSSNRVWGKTLWGETLELFQYIISQILA